MDSQNEGSLPHRHLNGVDPDDELQRCEQVRDIRARIRQLDKSQAQTKRRKQKLLENRQQRLRLSRDVSLSISNNASAIFSTAKSRRQFEDQINIHRNIAEIKEEENKNLKEQNEYLKAKLVKMNEKQKKFKKIAEKAQKYKKLYEEAIEELNLAKQECQVYKNKAEQMKRIALLDVGKLENKILPFVKTMDQSYENQSQAYSRQKSDHQGNTKGSYSVDM